MDEDTRPLEETETLGQRIRRIRTQRGLSLAKVVRNDFSRAFLNQVEMGKARPSIRVLRVIAERLGTEVEYLLEGQQAGLERELALEKGRVLLAQGEPHRALLALRPALDSYDWPLGSDARVCQAEALIAMGRKEPAVPILANERNEIELHNDGHRRERLRTVERGDHFRYEGDAVKRHLQLADRAHRAGHVHDELEHYRAARVLLEATAPSQT
ncbi:MAG TPA: helix-turn-helix domain-containing protein [Candidatus Dormibacteraeota bacterium]|nr:helix-turn-helix domain-containing protein [Candidatus Dormibacteraeota bacterium]